MNNSPDYRRAGELYNQGQLTEAAQLLEQLLEADPDDLDVRHALAVCQTDLEQIPAARANLEWINQCDPHRHDDSYRLAVILQTAGERAAASLLYRRLLSEGAYRDASVRLAACEPTVAVSADSGPLPQYELRHQQRVTQGSIRVVVEASGNTSRGQRVCKMHQLPRHRLPKAARALLWPMATLALALALVLLAASHSLPDDGLATVGTPASVRAIIGWLARTAITVALLITIASLAWQLLNAKLFTVDIYEHGFDFAAGVLPRRRTFVWYMNMTKEPDYTRDGWSYLTRTASLEVKNSTDGGSTEDLKLEGIGSPTTVLALRDYLERRRLAERMDVKKWSST